MQSLKKESDLISDEKSKAIDGIRKKIDAHLESDSTDKLQGEYALAYCKYFGCSADYLYGIIDLPTHKDTDIHKETGLSETSISCLRGWYHDKYKKGWYYSDDIDTVNTILEYYGNIRKENAKNGTLNGFTLFHFISNFFNAHKFQRVQQDLIRYGNGTHFNRIEKGDIIKKKDSEKEEIIEKICTPLSSITHGGADTTKLELVNTENEEELYYVEVSDIYREHCKSQIIDILKKIGNIE